MAWIIRYRTGGTRNGRWHLVLTRFGSEAQARARAAEIERMGYPTIITPAEEG